MKQILLISLFVIQVSVINSQWISNISGKSNSDTYIENARGMAITVDNEEYSYVAGYISGISSGKDIAVIKYSPLGDTVWMKTFNGTENSDDEASAIVLGSDGSIYVTGFVSNNFTGKDIILLKYKSSGDLEWFINYFYNGSYSDDRGLDMKIDNSDNIFLTGYVTDNSGNVLIAAQKYSSGGALIWSTIDLSFSGTNHGKKIETDNSGNAYVTGFVNQGGSSDIVLVKYNTAGNIVFRQTAGGSGEDKAWGIAVDDDSFIYITGYTTNSESNTDCFTAKYNVFGEMLWSRTFNGNGNAEDKAWGIAVDDDNAVYITGNAADIQNNSNFIVIKYSSTGLTIWEAEYDGSGSGNDKANVIGLIYTNDSVTSVVAAGESWGTEGNYDFAAVRFDAATGQQISANRYSMSTNTDDAVLDMAVSVINGKIFLTGYSELIIESMNIQSYITSLMLLINTQHESISNSLIPKSYILSQNYPNPFNPLTTINFGLPENAEISLKIYDVLGRIVDIPFNGYMNAGFYSYRFKSTDLPSGIYFYSLSSANFSETKKMIIIK